MTNSFDLRESNFEYTNDTTTIGKLKNPKEFMKNFKRIGGINVNLLKEFLGKLPEDDELCIGVYLVKRNKNKVKKGDLAPLHCRGFLIAPRRVTGKIKVTNEYASDYQDKREFGREEEKGK